MEWVQLKKLLKELRTICKLYSITTSLNLIKNSKVKWLWSFFMQFDKQIKTSFISIL